jgi:hypothetical protein
MNKLKSKQALIDEFNKKNVMNIHETDVKYVVIRFDPIEWCKFEPLECIFAEEDTFEEFNKELIKIIKEKYPEEARTITDIQYSLSVVTNVPENICIIKKNYTGKVWDSVKDNDVLFVAWIQRTEWKACYNNSRIPK